MAATGNKQNPILSLHDKTTHVIVEFNDYGRKSIELVLRSWLSLGKKNAWFCAYPTGSDMQFAEDYVRDNKSPEILWSMHKVKILQQASSYEQGLRRLERWIEGEERTVSTGTLSDEFAIVPNSGSLGCVAKNIIDAEYDGAKDTDDTLSYIDDDKHDKVVDARGTEKKDTLQCMADLKGSFNETMQKMEERLKKKMNRTEQSILFEVRQQFKILMSSVVPDVGLKSIGQTLSKCKSTLGVEEVQRQTLDDFISFEEMIGTDKEKREALKTWMILIQNGARDLKESVSKILSAYIVKTVQLRYSGCGRKVKGEGKQDFSATHAFACMTEVLLDIHPCNKDVIRTTSGKWLSGAGDRDGGKKARSLVES